MAQDSAALTREIFLAGFMAGLPPENVAWATPRLARNMVDLHLAAGEVVYRQGDPSDAHFFVVTGEVELRADGVPPWRLGERSLVGTMDITLERPRARTATTTCETHLLRMPAADWLEMQEDNFELSLRAIEGLAGMVHDTRVSLLDFETGLVRAAPYEPPAGADALDLLQRVALLRRVPLFSRGEVQSLMNLAVNAEEKRWDAGTVIVPRGEPDDGMYVVVAGSVRVVHGACVAEETFGAGQLVLASRAASSRPQDLELSASEPTWALRICREDYFDTMEEHFALTRSAMKTLAAEREILTNQKIRATVPPKKT